MSIIPVQPVVKKYVFWGNQLPKIRGYKNGVMCASHDFTIYDGFLMELGCLRLLNYGPEEMADGSMREHVRGYRLYAEFAIKNVQNRAIMVFLQQLFSADEIIFYPHDGSMENPVNQTYYFKMLLQSNFDPKYTDGRFIGHQIAFNLIGVELLPAVPRCISTLNPIKAETMRADGATIAEPETSKSVWGEKMYYGGWEVSEDDLRWCAYWEYVDPIDRDPYGDFT